MQTLFVLAAAATLAWLVCALFENGPTLAGALIVALTFWALVDYA